MLYAPDFKNGEHGVSVTSPVATDEWAECENATDESTLTAAEAQTKLSHASNKHVPTNMGTNPTPLGRNKHTATNKPPNTVQTPVTDPTLDMAITTGLIPKAQHQTLLTIFSEIWTTTDISNNRLQTIRTHSTTYSEVQQPTTKDTSIVCRQIPGEKSSLDLPVKELLYSFTYIHLHSLTFSYIMFFQLLDIY